jgi:hypothetical protein
MSKVQVGADRNRANRFGVKVAFVFLKALVPGILLCLSVPSTAAQANAKNVLVLFSSVKYSEAFLDAVEPFIRARVPGPSTFYDAYLDDPQVEQRSLSDPAAPMPQGDNSFCLLRNCWRYARGVPGVNRPSKAVDLLVAREASKAGALGRRTVPAGATEAS